MKTKSIFALTMLITVILIFAGCGISQYNQETSLRNSFNQKFTERTAFYDKMWKIISQKSQVALRNDSSFRQNINIIMEGRKDSPQVFFKWVTETNPNANFNEVSALYKDLSRSIEAEREGFFNQEKVLQDIKLQHDNLLNKIPSVFLLSMLGKKPLDYKPVTSDKTDGVISTGKDNDTKVF